MPRFQLQYRINEEVVEASDWREYPDLDAAHSWALVWAYDLLSEAVDAGEPPTAARAIEIAGGEGEVLLYLVFWGSLLLPPIGHSGAIY